MEVRRLAIPDVILVTPPRFADSRGWFSEAWNATRFAEAGISGRFVQDNQSFSAARGTIRGLHCQVGAAAQGKLVRVLAGRIWDVAVDLRRGSPHFGCHVAAELSAGNGAQLWIPTGFLHGFCTLEPATEVLYKVTAPYDRAAERGVVWNDATLALPWPVEPASCILSDKDSALPALGSPEWFTA